MSGGADRDEAGGIGSQHIVAGAFLLVPGKSCIPADDIDHLHLPVVCLIIVQVRPYDLKSICLQISRQVILKKGLGAVGNRGGRIVAIKL